MTSRLQKRIPNKVYGIWRGKQYIMPLQQKGLIFLQVLASRGVGCSKASESRIAQEL